MLENLYIEATKNCPEIKSENGEMKISGKCYPENSRKFFDPLLAAIDNGNGDLREVTIQIDYINSSSTLMLIKLLKKLKSNLDDITINWITEIDDEEMEQIGQEVEEIVGHTLMFRKI